MFISEGQNAVRSMIISIPQSESERVGVGEGWGGVGWRAGEKEVERGDRTCLDNTVYTLLGGDQCVSVLFFDGVGS